MENKNSDHPAGYQPQQFPTISGALNNCALNCALPSILAKITELANNPNQDMEYIESYRLLKEFFEHHYALERQLSWSEFAAFIAKFNFAEIELIFAPVLRQFIASQAAADDHNFNLLRDIVDNPLDHLDEDVRTFYAENPKALEGIELATPGRYFALQPHEPARYFYSKFGLSVQVYNWNVETKSYVAEAQTTIHNDQPTFSARQQINLYLKVGHYELQPHESLPAVTQERLKDTLEQAREAISSDLSSVTTNRALATLIPFVRRYLQQEDTPNAIEEDSHYIAIEKSLSFKKYFSQANEYNLHNDSREGQLYFAIILLVLMENDVDAKINAFATKYLDQLKQLTDATSDKTQQLTNIIIQKISDFCAEQPKQPIADEAIISTPKPKSITRHQLNKILNTYKTTYVVYNFFLWVFSLGQHGYSGTMLALRQLLNNDKTKETFTADEIGVAIGSKMNHDSRKLARYRFFISGKYSAGYENTGTDEVLESLKIALT